MKSDFTINTAASPEDVAALIKEDLMRHYSLSQVGAMFGVSCERIRQLLNGRSYMSAKWAGKFEDELGYSFDFLTRGQGEMNAGQSGKIKELSDLMCDYCSLRDARDAAEERWERIKDSGVFSLQEKQKILSERNLARGRYRKVADRLYTMIGYVGHHTSDETWEREEQGERFRDILKQLNKF